MNFVFRQFNLLLSFRYTQSAKKEKTCLRSVILNCSEKLQNIYEIRLKKCEVIV